MIQSNHVENRTVRPGRMTLRLPAHVHDALKRAALAEGETESTVVRRALRRELLDVDALIESR